MWKRFFLIIEPIEMNTETRPTKKAPRQSCGAKRIIELMCMRFKAYDYLYLAIFTHLPLAYLTILIPL